MIGNENKNDFATVNYQVEIVKTRKTESGENERIAPYFKFIRVYDSVDLTPEQIEKYESDSSIRKDRKDRFFVPVARETQFSGYFSSFKLGYYNEKFDIQNSSFNLFDYNKKEGVVENYWFNFKTNDHFGKDVVNQMLGLENDKKYVGRRLKLSVYERPGKGDKSNEKFPAFSLFYQSDVKENKFELVSWKHDPMKDERFKGKKVGKKVLYDDLYEFLTEEIKQFSFERMNYSDVVPKNTNSSSSNESEDFEDVEEGNVDNVEKQQVSEEEPVENLPEEVEVDDDDLPF